MKRPDIEMFARLAARLPAGDPTRQQFEDLAGYVSHLEAQVASLTARVSEAEHQAGTASASGQKEIRAIPPADGKRSRW
jgi:outer membrane murein-binding lipoprotein Lpp